MCSSMRILLLSSPPSRIERALHKVHTRVHIGFSSLFHPSPCAEANLVAQFVSLFGLLPLDQNPSGLWRSWVNLVPSRVGSSATLDRAAACFISGSLAYINPQDDNWHTAQVRYGSALKSLQASFSNKGTSRASLSLLLSYFHLSK